MSFNKEKALSAAEKLVTKGKIDAAIKEYQKVLAKTGEDPRLLNTLGDLFARLRKNDQAVKYWEKAAEKLEHDGFYPRAIAIQKKAQRANPGSLSVHLRLAELNRKLGLTNEARGHYQHLVDHYLRANDAASAIGVLQKLIELEPDHLNHRVRLADLYRQQQLTAKAMSEHANIAAVLESHGQYEQALQVYLRALDLDATDTEFLRRALTALISGGAVTEAQQLFSASLRRNPAVETLRPLLGAADGLPLAEEPEAVFQPEQPYSRGQSYQGADQVPTSGSGGYTGFEAALRAPSYEPTPQPGDFASALDSSSGSGSTDYGTSDPVVSDFSGFEIITPDDDALGEVELRSPGTALGEVANDGFVIDIDDEEPATLVRPPPDMLRPQAPGQPVTPGSAFQADEVEITLEDSFLQPVQPARDVPPGLQDTGPSPMPVAEGLDFSFADEPELDRGDGDDVIHLEIEESGSRDIEFPSATPHVPVSPAVAPDRRGFGFRPSPPPEPAVAADEQDFEIEFPIEGMTAAASAAPSPPPFAPRSPVPPRVVLPAPPPPVAAQPVPVEPFVLAETAPPPVIDSAQRVRDLLAEAEVFVKYGLQEKAVDRLEEVLSLDPGHLGAVTQLLRLQLERGEHARVVPLASQLYVEAQETGAMELWEELKATLQHAGYGFDRDAIVALPGEAQPARYQEPAIAEAVRDAGFVDLAVMGSEIDHEMREEAAPVAPPTAQLLEGAAVPVVAAGTSWLDEPPAEAVVAPSGRLFEDEEKLFDLAVELQGELEPPEQAVPIAPEEQSLEEIVEGFKKGVAENLSPEDSDTHYNLGIAYREMLLLDEAISEFQIAAKNADYLVNCCAMLGLCFREKGLPDLALKWYRRALESDRIDEGQTLGMLYEIGSVYLETDDRQSAYNTFVEIYGMNTNYRDVAVKMQELTP